MDLVYRQQSRERREKGEGRRRRGVIRLLRGGDFEINEPVCRTQKSQNLNFASEHYKPF